MFTRKQLQNPRSDGRNVQRKSFLERARILLAYDHPEFLSLAAGLIEAEFDVLKTFGNGQAVVDEFSALNPDLVVLDISMPGLNGIETAHRLRAGRVSAKIVFLTVHKALDYLRSALATGALGYVAKDRLASDQISRDASSPGWAALCFVLITAGARRMKGWMDCNSNFKPTA